MPQEYVKRLAADPRLTLVTHLVATLQAKITWENRKVLLVGYLPETPQATSGDKRPMGYNVKSDAVLLGYELGVGHKAGDTIRVLDRPFRIARILPEQGSKEDISIAMRLEDAQALLKKPGRINQIMALGCRCAGSTLADVREQLEAVLPETRITEFRAIAAARDEQRALVEESRDRVEERLTMLAHLVPPLVVVAAAVWVGLLSLANVRERRTEIGLLRALGKGSGLIAWLFLGKAVLLGLLGGLIGLPAGAWLAEGLGVWVLGVPAANFALPFQTLLCALVGAPAVAALASYLPMLVALTQDPAVALREG
jgi:predicted lysophospholipase L1 biosynthesis ABC-type transport system permease subunit